LSRGRDVHVVQDEERVVPAELSDELLHVAAGCLAQGLPDLGRAGEGDHVDVRVVRERGLGNCNHRRYIPKLLDLVATGLVDPTAFITQKQPPESAIAAYETFDRREDGWLKTILEVS
jgi:hypothetical protein